MAHADIQHCFADRIGGRQFGHDTTIYKFERIKRAKAAAAKEHPDVELIDMGVGEPDEAAFAPVVERLCDEAGKWENRQYTDNGIAEFKEAVAAYMHDLYGVDLDPEAEVNHSIGSKSALSHLPACFVNPGDVSVMTVPGYPVMGTWTRYLGGETVNLPLRKENGFLPDLDSLSDAQRKRTKLIYLNYPNNPTGACATPEFFDAAIRFARENGALIVSDAAYAPLVFSGHPLSILSRPGGKECAVELHSMSKGFNMTGWRLGWVCGHRDAVKAYATVKDNADSGQFAAIQKASIWALEHHGELTSGLREKYQRRLSGLTDVLKQLGFDARVPQGSFYLYVESPTGTTDGQTFENAEQFSEWMIREKQISTVPWDEAGHFARFSATFVAPTPEEEKRVLDEIHNRLSTSQFQF